MFGVMVSSSYESIAQGIKEVIKVFFSNGVSGRTIYCWSGDYTMAVFYCYVFSLEVVLLERWKLVMLNAGFDNNSDAAVGLSIGMLGMVEIITVFVDEVSFRYEHYVDLLLF